MTQGSQGPMIPVLEFIPPMTYRNMEQLVASGTIAGLDHVFCFTGMLIGSLDRYSLMPRCLVHHHTTPFFEDVPWLWPGIFLQFNVAMFTLFLL